MERKENVEKMVEIKQQLDQVLADKETQLESLQKEIEMLKSICNQMSGLVSGVSFVSAADMLGKMPPPIDDGVNIGEVAPAKVSPPRGTGSTQWEKYISNDAGKLLAKLVYDGASTTITFTQPAATKLKKDNPLFQDFFIQKILLHLKEESPGLVLDFEETAGFIKKIVLSQMGSEDNFTKIEKAVEHLLKKIS